MTNDTPVQVHIVAAPYNADIPPTIVFGFAGSNFSQAVYLTAAEDAGQAVANADIMYKAYLEACAAAIKEWKSHAEETGSKSEASSDS